MGLNLENAKTTETKINVAITNVGTMTDAGNSGIVQIEDELIFIIWVLLVCRLPIV